MIGMLTSSLNRESVIFGSNTPYLIGMSAFSSICTVLSKFCHVLHTSSLSALALSQGFTVN